MRVPQFSPFWCLTDSPTVHLGSVWLPLCPLNVHSLSALPSTAISFRGLLGATQRLYNTSQLAGSRRALCDLRGKDGIESNSHFTLCWLFGPHMKCARSFFAFQTTFPAALTLSEKVLRSLCVWDNQRKLKNWEFLHRDMPPSCSACLNPRLSNSENPSNFPEKRV